MSVYRDALKRALRRLLLVLEPWRIVLESFRRELSTKFVRVSSGIRICYYIYFIICLIAIKGIEIGRKDSFESIHREIHSRTVQLRLLAAMIKEAWPTFLESEVSCLGTIRTKR